ncbi:GDP-mannose 4,6-dehydratase [Nitrosopumilus sp. S6]
MKIMISGSSGFIGSHLSEKLLNKNNLILLVRNKSKLINFPTTSKNVKLETANVSNFNSIFKLVKKHKPDIIIHLAGQTSHSISFKKPFTDLKSNTNSTLNFLESIRQLNLKTKFILGSTFIVIGKPKKLPVTENSICTPNSPYAINKLASEHYCQTYNLVYGIDTRIFRITNSFGPREKTISTKNALNYLIHEAYLNHDITIFNRGKFFRDVIYISDVVDAIIKIMKKGKPGNLYWIASGKKTWFYQIGKILEELTNSKIKYASTPKYTKKVDVGNFLVDNSKLKKLGWKPKVSVKEGIKQTIQYFEEQKT